MDLIRWIVKVRYYSVCRDHVSFLPLQKKKKETEEYVTILVNMDNIIILLLLNCHLEMLRLFRVIQLNPLVIIVTANIQVN